MPDIVKPEPPPKVAIEDILALLPPPSEFPKIIKYMSKKLPEKRIPVPQVETPAEIVESTLQAISLSKMRD